MKIHLFNGICSTIMWVIFNSFFLLLNAIIDIYEHTRFGILLGNPKPLKFQILIFIVISLFVIVWSILFFQLGKKTLKISDTIIDYISIFLFHPIVLLLLYFSIQSESSMIDTINWFVQVIPISKVRINLYDSFLANALLTFYPYICLALGMTKRKNCSTRSKMRNTGNGTMS